MNRFFTCCLIMLAACARGQHLPDRPTLVAADKIVLDSTFTAPVKSMPFDRHFILQFSVPGKADVLGFLLVPINKRKRKSVTRRDYRVYIRSITTNAEKRRDARGLMPYILFKDPATEHPFVHKEVETRFKGKKTEINLLVPPLDPHRDYLVRIYKSDTQMLDIYFGMNASLFSIVSSKGTVDTLAFNQLKQSYDKIEPKLFKKDDLFQFLSKVNCANDIPIRVDAPELQGQQQYFEMRFVFSKDSLTKQDVATLQKNRFLCIESDHIPKQISASMLFALASKQRIADAKGDVISFLQDSTTPYSLYLMISGYKRSLAQINTNPIPIKDTILTKLGTVKFLGNDPKKISWIFSDSTKECEADKETMANLKAINTNKLSLLQNPSISVLTAASNSILAGLASECPCKDAEVVNAGDREELLKVLGYFYDMPENYIPQTVSGYATLSNPYGLAPKDSTGRLTNIEMSLKSLVQLEGIIRRVPARTRDTLIIQNLKSVLAFVKKYRSIAESNRNKLKAYITAEDKLRTYYRNSVFPAEPDDITGVSSRVFNFMTDSKFKIVPDFGLVVISGLPDRAVVKDVVPYLGFNINFRSIDKDIPMSSVLNKHWTYFFSFIGGITLNSVAIPNRREDLFGNNSLMLGFGFRVNNYLKVIGGAVLYKTFSTNPLSDKKPLGASPFAGLSLDYELKELFGGIKNLLK
ncbi:hypothetical protein [Arcticibacter tournemirensis]